MAVVCDCDSHLILGIHATRGPKADNRQLKPVLKNTIVEIQKLLGDAGFDGEVLLSSHYRTAKLKTSHWLLEA